MKKMLIVAGRIYGGGAERVLADLINGLPETEFDITLYTVTKDDFQKSGIIRSVDYRTVYADDTELSGFKKILKKVSNKIKNVVYAHLSARAFYRLVFKERYDIELAAIEGYATRIVSGSTNTESMKAAWLHTDLNDNGWSRIAYKNDGEEAEAYKKFDRVICVSENVRDILLEKYGEEIDTTVIVNPMRMDRVLALAAESEDCGFSAENGEALKIAYLGRLQQEKGADRLLEAVKMLRDEGEKIKLYMIGDGVQMPEIKRYINENELSDTVTLFGYLDNPYVYMKNADLFVCPSRAEGFGLVLVEAMFLSLPVMSTDCAGPREILGGGEYGALTENSTQGIYDGIKKFISEPELLSKYSALSIKRREDYGYENAINKFIDVFKYEK